MLHGPRFPNRVSIPRNHVGPFAEIDKSGSVLGYCWRIRSRDRTTGLGLSRPLSLHGRKAASSSAPRHVGLRYANPTELDRDFHVDVSFLHADPEPVCPITVAALGRDRERCAAVPTSAARGTSARPVGRLWAAERPARTSGGSESGRGLRHTTANDGSFGTA